MKAKEKLDNYINSLPEHYRAANLVFAHYAAFPSVFSPDLLYQFWFYLQGYKQNDKIENLPMVVVSDLLQSGLCQEIAYELFELDKEVVRYIKSDDKKHLLSAYQVELLHDEKDCASLTFEYAERYYKHSNKQNLYDLYYWKSSFKLNPAAASKEIKDILKNKNETKINNKNARIFLQIADYQLYSQNSNEEDINKLPTFSFTQKGTDSIDIEDDVVVREIARIIGLKENEISIPKFLTPIPKLLDNVVPREELIKEIYEKFQEKDINIINIFAQAGIGKTVFARLFLEKYENLYNQILWVGEGNPIRSTIEAVANKIGILITSRMSDQNAVNAIIDKLKELPAKNLFIIDGIESTIFYNEDLRNRLTNFDILTTSQSEVEFSDFQIVLERFDKYFLINDSNIDNLEIKNNFSLSTITINNSKIGNLDIKNNKNLTEIICNNSKIQTIDIRQCSQFNQLVFNNTQIGRFYGDGKSYNIKKIVINNSKLDNIRSFIADIKDLEELKFASYFDSNKISHPHTKKIKKLTINETELTDISFLKKFENLEYLNLKNNKIDTFDYSLLDELTNLKELYLQGNQLGGLFEEENCLPALKEWQNKNTLVNQQIKEIEEAFNKKIERIPKVDINLNDVYCLNDDNEIWYLSVYGGNCQDLSVLTNLTSLKKLLLHDMQIRDISPLQNLAQLTVISLQNNQIEDISALQNLNLLKNIYLDNNQIRVIPDFRELTYLKILTARENQITDISGIQYLTNLSNLDLHNNQISDISPLKRLKGLDLLQLNFNKIEDITPLKDLIQIRSIFLNNNNIIDISLLGNLENLTSLSISNNQITDIDIVVNLKNLIIFYVNDNRIGFFPVDLVKEAANLYELSFTGNPIKNLPNVVFDNYHNCLPKLKKWLGHYPFIAILVKGENDLIDLKLELASSENRGMGIENHYEAILESGNIDIEFDFWEYPIGKASHISVNPENNNIVGNNLQQLCFQFQAYLDNKYADVILPDYQDYLDSFCNSQASDDVKKKTIKSLIENGQFLNQTIQNLLEEELKPIIIQDFIFEETLEVLGINDIGYGEKSHEIVVYGNNNAVLQVNMDYRDMDNVRIYTLPFKFVAHLKKGKEWFMDSCSFSINTSSYNIGVVTRYFDEKGFGFINATTATSKSEGIFFHIKQCVDRNYMPTVGDKVVYDAVPDRTEGKVQANNVVFIDSQIGFKTPKEALQFFIENPNTSRKDEIIEILLLDAVFLEKVMDFHLSEAISNDFAIADGHSFSIKKITNFKWFYDNNSITLAGEGITSILLENAKNNKIEKAFHEETTFSGELYYNEEYNDWEFEGLFEFPSIKEMLEQSNYEIAQGCKDNGKDWDWWLWIEANEEDLDKIRDVTYYLHSTFKEPIRSITDRSTNYKLTTSGWGTFVIKIEINLKSGVIVKLEHQLKFDRQNELFDTPQEALNFFVENLKTTRKSEIIEILLDTPSFLENLLSESIYNELLNFVAGNPEIEETIVEKITKLEFIKRDIEILLVGSGTTSVNSRFEDIKIHDNFSFTFDIRIGQDTKKQWVLADNEKNEVTVFKQEDENTPSDELYKNEEVILDRASIKQLIAQYRIKEAIDALSKVLPMHEQNNILSLAAHWSSLEHLSNIGFLDSEDDIARNKVIHELLSLCDNI